MIYLGVNISHHASIAIYDSCSKKIIDFYNEQRFKKKKDWEPSDKYSFYLSIFEKIKEKPYAVCYASFGRDQLDYNNHDEIIINNLQKQLNHPTYFFNKNHHHLYHVLCGFYFSSFKEAICIVIDGGGSQSYSPGYQEIESVFFVNKNSIQPLFQSVSNFKYLNAIWENFPVANIPDITMTNNDGTFITYSSQCYGGLSFYFNTKKINFKNGEEGKLMGLASYGNSQQQFDLDYNKVSIAKQTQEDHFNKTCSLIDKVIQLNKTNNIILTGGCALNCSNNFKFVKKYPNLNFFVDPIPSDAGTSIGACVYYDSYK